MRAYRIPCNILDDNTTYFSKYYDNLCDNALDLNSSQININNKKWPTKVNCKWVISAEGNNSYLSLEIEEINVSTNSRELLKVIKKVSISKIILYS